MRYSENFELDWKFYNNFKHIHTFCGVDIKQKYNKFKQSDSGKSAKECFYIFDSTGKYSDCKELDLLFEILQCKASVNLFIKQVADEYKENLEQSIKMYNEKVIPEVLEDMFKQYNISDMDKHIMIQKYWENYADEILNDVLFRDEFVDDIRLEYPKWVREAITKNKYESRFVRKRS